MEHIAERSRFGGRAERSKTGAVTTRRPERGPTLAVAAAGTLLVLVAFTTPLTTLSGTAAGLGAGPGAQAWVLSSMNVGTAAALMSSGAIGDDYGRRRTFLAGALVLAGASALCALAPNALVLVLARVLQGLGGAAVLACGLGLIGHAFPEGQARVRATGVWGAGRRGRGRTDPGRRARRRRRLAAALRGDGAGRGGARRCRMGPSVRVAGGKAAPGRCGRH